jgi:hypothetical protein
VIGVRLKGRGTKPRHQSEQSAYYLVNGMASTLAGNHSPYSQGAALVILNAA